MNQEVLITIESFMGDRFQKMKEVVQKLLEIVQKMKVSSVFEVGGSDLHASPLRGSWNSGREWGALTVAVRGTTEIPTVFEFFDKLQSIEGDLNRSTRCVDVDLIFFGDLLWRTPELTIPHPEFHRRPYLVIPAAEIAGKMKHPVLEKPLEQMTDSYQNQHWGQYYTQGIRLLSAE